MRIGIDMDCTVADLMDTLKPYILEKKPDYNLKDISLYNLECVGLMKEDCNKIFTGFKDTKENLTMKVFPNAVQTINEMSRDNQIYFISARDQYKGVVDDSYKWLIDNGFKFDGLICEQRDKYPIIKQMKIDLMIDDHPDILLDLAGKNIEVICYDQPWNRQLKNIRRIKNWSELYGAFSKTKVKDIKAPYPSLKVFGSKT